MKKIFRVLVILTLCIFGIAYKKKMCVAILKYYNNLKEIWEWLLQISF